MKLCIFDRILTVIAMLLFVAIGAGLIGMCFLFNQEQVASLVSFAYSGTTAQLITAIVGLILLIIAVRLIIAVSASNKGKNQNSVVVATYDFGETRITLGTIEMMVQKHCRANTSVKECNNSVRAVENGVEIALRIAVTTDTVIPEFSNNLQVTLKEYIETLAGVNVSKIALRIVPPVQKPQSIQ